MVDESDIVLLVLASQMVVDMGILPRAEIHCEVCDVLCIKKLNVVGLSRNISLKLLFKMLPNDREDIVFHITNVSLKHLILYHAM